MTRAFSPAFRQNIVAKLLGPNAPSQAQLAREIGVRQQNLSRWLDEALDPPALIAPDNSSVARSVQDKVRILGQGLPLTPDQLTTFLTTEGVQLADFERWRSTLESEGPLPVAANKRMRQLERELTLKDRALAEAATLLMLKRTIRGHYRRDDDDADDDEP